MKYGMLLHEIRTRSSVYKPATNNCVPKARPHGCQSHNEEKSNQKNKKGCGDTVDNQGSGGVGENIVAHGEWTSLSLMSH